ncbi:uncharacterized protein MELLADRAFT_59707 [Melampsora larici-populina 98AG31]|uniref:Uncharacterized protein n=1 Tax=Melampsora larici-populina (strain 98AG31 / pathotype 3-4-7) TaxID=747676 RepID=F4R8J5_MELLP|nr:uncharacterized protein MELLADRAFT_59707 [Melampsora larici-populina 98AG31]EGG11491.1 hypothetical protein MELLADRAFT_59707 [Melampsora larici-populina 98AG31]
MSGSNIPLKQSHVVTVSGIVENSAVYSNVAPTYLPLQHPPSDNRNYSYRSCTAAITCNGWNGDNKKEYDGKFTAYCSSLQVPHEGECYCIKARFLPAKDSADFNMYYEAEHKVFVGTSETFIGVLHHNTALSGLGIVSSRRTIPDEDDTKSTLCFVMKHIDYQPQARKNQYFEIEYRIRPTRNMEKSQNLVQVGRETLISGFIVDWDGEHNRWIVEVIPSFPTSFIPEPVLILLLAFIGHRRISRPQLPLPMQSRLAGPSSTPVSAQSATAAKRKVPPVEEALFSPPVTGRRTRPAKHVPKTVKPVAAKSGRAVGKGKAKAATPVQEAEEPPANEEFLSETEWPLTPVPPAKKASPVKAKKAKPASKPLPLDEEPADDVDEPLEDSEAESEQ